MHQLSSWCKQIGEKLVDASIDPDLVLQGTLKAQPTDLRPRTMPIAVDWPEKIYTSLEAEWSFHIRGDRVPLSDVSLELVSPSVDGPLRLSVSAADASEDIELQLFDRDGVPAFDFLCRDSLRVQHGNGEPRSARAFFNEDPLVIWFADGSSLEGNQLVELRRTGPPYDREKIEVWDWEGVQIRRESQGKRKNPNTIQARTISRLIGLNRYRVVVDDDGKGEAADIVAIHVVGEGPKREIAVDFYHCKFSAKETPGARIDDLYQVCGQAQKSIHWMTTPEKRTDLFTHLLRREAARGSKKGTTSRFQIGDNEELLSIREMSRSCPVSLRIFIVQPGLSKSRASLEQLELLSVSETYLFETFRIQFGVIASA